MYVTVVFFIPGLVLLAFQFTPWNNVLFYTKFCMGWSTNWGVELLSPI